MSRDALKLAATTYKIVRQKRIICDGDPATGTCDFDRRIIKIQLNLPPDIEYETEWHESAHAMDDAFSLGLTHEQITALGKALAQVMPDNQWLGQPRMRE